MATLALPPAGRVYLDANPIIYAVEQIAPYAALLSPLWTAARNGQVSLVTSELSWMETRVKPLRDGDTVLDTLFRDFLTARELQLLPVTRGVWEEAARLRAALNLKTPDALHAAGALEAGCAMFLTNDPAFGRVPGLPVSLLNAVLNT